MKQQRKFILIVMGLFLLLSNCRYDNEVDYFKSSTNQCDTLNMSFQTDVNPVITASCLGCHGNAGAAFGINLEGYDNVKKNSANMLKTIEQKPGVPPMPQGSAKLSDCTINKINAWINQGLKNN
jgi:hypothetical protein